MPFFLFSLRRRTRSPFSSKNFFVLLPQVSSAAILFAENRYTEQFFVVFFFHGKKFFLKIFFPEVGKPSTEISRENKIADFRKNAEDWKHCFMNYVALHLNYHFPFSNFSYFKFLSINVLTYLPNEKGLPDPRHCLNF